MSSIIDIKSMHQVLDHISEKTDLVFFDIDNTLLTASDCANPTKWAEGLECYVRTIYARHHNLTEKQQNELINHDIAEYINTMQPRLIEDFTRDLIKELQQRTLNVIALTARPLTTVASTIQQLNCCGINLANHAFNPKSFTSNSMQMPIIFQDGIITCSQNPKGLTAKYFFETINFKPRSVVFIDDTRHYLEEAEQQLKLMNIAFTGLRYGNLDELTQQFIFSDEHIPPLLR